MGETDGALTSGSSWSSGGGIMSSKKLVVFDNSKSSEEDRPIGERVTPLHQDNRRASLSK